jgi:transcriptional regulator with XRE-family HTH domain
MMLEGERVRRRREALGMTQEELAKAAGMTHAAISQVEHGKRQPYPRTMKRLAAALGVELGALLGDEEYIAGRLQPGLARRADVWDASGGRCYYCGKQLHPFRDFHIDHFIAKSNGGADERDNLVASCRECNWDKRMVLDWPERRRQRQEQGIVTWRAPNQKRNDAALARAGGQDGAADLAARLQNLETVYEQDFIDDAADAPSDLAPTPPEGVINALDEHERAERG